MLNRKNVKVFASNSGDKGTNKYGSIRGSGQADYTKDIDLIQNENWEVGLRSALITIDGKGKAPIVTDTNSVYYVLSYLLKYLYQKGYAEYSANETYYKGSICVYIDNNVLGFYECLENEVTNISPINTTYWRLYYSKSLIDDLQEQINTIIAKSDVTDIVNTYQDLLDYDISTLTDKDIIQVLQDNQHSNSVSYYRYVITTSPNYEWQYIGSLASYYTKAETDNLLLSKVNVAQGAENAGKVLGIGNDGNVVPQTNNAGFKLGSYSVAIPISSAPFIAPADGLVCFEGKTTTTNLNCYLINNTSDYNSDFTGIQGTGTAYARHLWVKKGDSISLNANCLNNSTNRTYKFIYALGQEPDND